MNSIAPISGPATTSIIETIFAKSVPTVAEAYSEYGEELRLFDSAEKLSSFAMQLRTKPNANLHVAVLYPDMGGRLHKRRIVLIPEKCNGHTYRYGAEGLGLVWINLHLNGISAVGSSVSANSQKRAEKWAASYPELDPPNTWNWPVVAGHLRRLRSALGKIV